MTPTRQNRLSRGAGRLAAWGLLLSSAVGALGQEATLDLEAWSKWRPRIRELVARRVDADGRVSYLLFVLDGENYVVKTAPSEKLLRARVLTRDIDVAGRCGDEFWVARGRFVNFADHLRFLRKGDMDSSETNYVASTLQGNYGVARLAFAFLYLGVDPFGLDLSRRLEQLQLTEGGFELTGRQFTNAVAVQRVETRGMKLAYRLLVTVTGASDGQGGQFKSTGAIEGELEPGNFIPVRFCFQDLDLARPQIVATIERLSLELSDSPLSLRLFRPELYVQEGFPMVMRMDGDKVVMTPAHDPSWRKVVLFGHAFSYRLVKWGVITLIAAITVIAAIVVRNQQRKQQQKAPGETSIT
jgi:hypothetical protein